MCPYCGVRDINHIYGFNEESDNIIVLLQEESIEVML